MTIGTAVEPALCSCGCGEATNAVVIEAQRLHDENGESWASASAKLGVSYAYIKTIRKNPAKSLRGHNRLPTSSERPCVVCGKAFFSSLPPEKLNVCSSGFCTLERWKQRRVEWVANNAVMREVWRHRNLVKESERVRLRARRLLRRLEREREAEAVRAWRGRLQRERVAEREERRQYQLAKHQRRIDCEAQKDLDRVIRRVLRRAEAENRRLAETKRVDEARQRRIDRLEQSDLDRLIRRVLRAARAEQRRVAYAAVRESRVMWRHQRDLDRLEQSDLDRLIRRALRGVQTEAQRREAEQKRRARREEAVFWRTVGNNEIRHLHRLAQWSERAERKRERERERLEQREQRRLEQVRLKVVRQQQRERLREERRVKRAFQFGGQRDRIKGHVGRGVSDDHFLSTRQMTYHSDQWHDDVFEEVADRIDVDEHQFFVFAKQAVFVPEDFYQRCRNGGLCLVVDDEGVRFLARRDRRTEIIPRFDPGVAIPTQASGSSGKKSSRHRGRHARSASAQGKRSSRSQPKVSR